MKFLKIIFRLILCICLGFTAWLTWQNWTSKEIVVAFIAAIGGIASLLAVTTRIDTGEKAKSFVIGGAWIAIFGSFITLFYGLRSIEIRVDFPVEYVFHKETLRPLGDRFNIERYSLISLRDDLTSGVIQALTEKDLTIKGHGREIYTDILLRNILDNLFMIHHYSWNVIVKKYELPGETTTWWEPQEGALAADYVTFEDMKESVSKSVVFQNFPPFHTKMAVPKGTTLKLVIGDNIREILINNSFVDIRISFSLRSIGRMGLGGYKLILGLDDEDIRSYEKATFLVDLVAKFNRFKCGHPKMPKYIQWVESMFMELQETFDSRIKDKISKN